MAFIDYNGDLALGFDMADTRGSGFRLASMPYYSVPAKPDDGGEHYAGNLVVDVSPDALGRFVVDFDRRLDASFIHTEEGTSQPTSPRVAMPVGEFFPAFITVSTGCCHGNGCSDLDLTSCLASGGTPVPACGGDCNGNGHNDACEVANGSVNDCNDNLVPDDCETDCNGNAVPDDCDLASGTSSDCNGNTVPDACDLADGTSLDCNGNDIPDECDIASGASGDCNFDGVPDECQPDEDCNNNTVRDICDIGAGTSEDCNFDLIPDDCQPDEDCNTNTIRDLCEIGAGTEPDCNGNLSIDACDIAGGGSLDDNADGVPDECCQSPTPIFVGPLKSRYLSLESVGTPGVRSAIRVTFVDNDAYPAINGQSLWVGPPRDDPDEDVSKPGQTFTAAGLSCAPHYHDWSTIDVLHVFGAEIVPESSYEVQLINEGCPDSLETNYSAPLAANTGRWGDMSPPFAGQDGSTQPDFGDIAACVRKFRAEGSRCGGISSGTLCASDADCGADICLPIAPIKAQAQLQPNVVHPDRAINFKDIAAAVQAFLGQPLIVALPDPGPCACPSNVICYAEPCLTDLDCTVGGGEDRIQYGICVNGFCADFCGRCAP